MKKIFLFVVMAFAIMSCAPSRYCQMYQTKPISDVSVKEDYLLFEDENCKIGYNFWKEYGEIGFVFFNKTSENLYIHLDECFYVANGCAYDYYGNRMYTQNRATTVSTNLSYIGGAMNSNTMANAFANYYSVGDYGHGNANVSSYTYSNGTVVGNSKTTISTSSNSITVAEKRVICVPAHSSKSVSEFVISANLYRSCDIYLKPSKKQPNSVEFSKENTPLVFGNRICYSKGESEELIRVNNEFYVSKISNYPLNKVTELRTDEICGERQQTQTRYFLKSGPDQFYIMYVPTKVH